ncbi:cell division protein FtsK [Lottiidibacillus patelloidae]|uniref:Cell division protein FtsK n=1 Tax=Lottiidibacillus patelloidae TaxID=2670334 RepID=A0A263BY84_9BACI|nr:DNA translocase FtsK [Lottiidibacillus patelloidae]OZM58630.1 cell division protein FtsK [Lottiidibacillus patelloidae]
MAKRKRKSKKKQNWKEQITYELLGLLMLASVVIAFEKLGVVGKVINHALLFLAGSYYGLLLFGLFLLSLYLIIKRKWPKFFSRRLIGAYILVFSLLLLSHVTLFEILSNGVGWRKPSVLYQTWDSFFIQLNNGYSDVNALGGGMIGAIGYAFFHVLFDSVGTKIVAFFLMIISFMLITGKSLNEVAQKYFSPIYKNMKIFSRNRVNASKKGVTNLFTKLKTMKEKDAENDEDETDVEYIVPTEEIVETIDIRNVDNEKHEPIIADFQENTKTENENNIAQQSETESPVQQNINKDGGKEDLPKKALVLNEVENKDYKLPPHSLLSSPKAKGQHRERQQIQANAKKLERTFQSFGVKAKVLKIHLGPAVTKYEVYPDVGVKVSKIVNLADDLALALAAKDIRIEAPIPGKSAVGIEVPNSEVSMVSLREVLEAGNIKESASKLAIVLGRDISGEPIVAELNKMPHLLVAGSTGSGKSVCINGIITSILMRAKPHEVKLMMIDPKMVELNVYNGIPHLLSPVVTEPKRAAQALKRVVNEMERRYELFSHSGTRNIEGYNEYIRRHNKESEAKQPELPYIVVIVDELADLMMVASGDVEDAITRLAQMARAAGIHLIIATQRPSVDVITGVIKANIPSRIAFGVSSQTDSRTIIDMGGAEKLLGRGDMLFLPVGSSKPTRIQGAFLSDEEVEAVVNYVISQQKAQYQQDMIPTDNEVQQQPEVEDELYDDAVQLVTEMQTASVSMLQRRFRIGYTRAARLIDAMELHGVVGPYEGSKPREVLVSKLEEASSE